MIEKSNKQLFQVVKQKQVSGKGRQNVQRFNKDFKGK